jgi:hypothetical protein
MRKIAPKRKNNPPPPSKESSPIQHQQNSSSPSIFDSLKQGFGFGIGSSIGHKVVESTFNSISKDSINHEVIQKECNLTTSQMYELYYKCLEEKNNDTKCNDILENK